MFSNIDSQILKMLFQSTLTVPHYREPKIAPHFNFLLQLFSFLPSVFHRQLSSNDEFNKKHFSNDNCCRITETFSNSKTFFFPLSIDTWVKNITFACFPRHFTKIIFFFSSVSVWKKRKKKATQEMVSLSESSKWFCSSFTPSFITKKLFGLKSVGS